jgi:ribosomal protein S19
MVRPRWKGPFIGNLVLPTDSSVHIRTDSRMSTILPSFVGRTFEIHNGQHYIPIKISETMVGHRLGEFAITKKPVIHKKKEDKSKQKGKK